MIDVLNMSGYAIYVWSSVFLALIVIAGNAWFAHRSLRSVRARITLISKSDRT